MQKWVSTVNVCSLCVFLLYAFVGVLSMVYAFMVLQVALLASATAGVASLASHRMPTQCLSIIRVENQDSYGKMGINGHTDSSKCLYM